MNSYHICFFQQFIQCFSLFTAISLKTLIWNIRIISNKFHSKRFHSRSNQSTNSSKSDNPQCFFKHLASYKYLSFPFSTFYKIICRNNISRRGKHQPNRNFTSRNRIAVRSICHNYPMCSSLRNINIICTISRTSDYFQIFCLIQQFLIYFYNTSHNKSVIFANYIQNFFTWNPNFHINFHIPSFLQSRNRLIINIFTN